MTNKDKYKIYSTSESDMSRIGDKINQYLDWTPDFELFSVNTVFDPNSHMYPIKTLIILKRVEKEETPKIQKS